MRYLYGDSALLGYEAVSLDYRFSMFRDEEVISSSSVEKKSVMLISRRKSVNLIFCPMVPSIR